MLLLELGKKNSPSGRLALRRRDTGMDSRAVDDRHDAWRYQYGNFLHAALAGGLDVDLCECDLWWPDWPVDAWGCPACTCGSVCWDAQTRLQGRGLRRSPRVAAKAIQRRMAASPWQTEATWHTEAALSEPASGDAGAAVVVLLPPRQGEGSRSC